MFGELVGAWLAQVWADQGRPDPFVLAELGPGRGTLMRDALRAAARACPGFRAAARLWLVETSPALRARAGRDARRRTRRAGPARVGGAAATARSSSSPTSSSTPCRSASSSAPTPLWRERLRRASTATRLALRLGPAAARRRARRPLPACSPTARSSRSRRGARRSPPTLGARIARHGGRGAHRRLRRLGRQRRHAAGACAATRRADPLAAPGEADLTAHVRFRALAEAAPAGARLRAGARRASSSSGSASPPARGRWRAAGPAAAADGDRRRASPLDPPGRNGKPLPGPGARRRTTRRRRRDSTDDPRNPDLGPAGGHPPRLLHPPRRRLLGHLRRAELRPRLRATSARRWR